MRFIPVYDPYQDDREHIMFIPEDSIRLAWVDDDGNLFMKTVIGAEAGVLVYRTYEGVSGGSCAESISRVKVSHGQTMTAIKMMKTKAKSKEHDVPNKMM